MTVQNGTHNIDKIFIGSSQIAYGYLGNDLIYSYKKKYRIPNNHYRVTQGYHERDNVGSEQVNFFGMPRDRDYDLTRFQTVFCMEGDFDITIKARIGFSDRQPHKVGIEFFGNERNGIWIYKKPYLYKEDHFLWLHFNGNEIPTNIEMTDVFSVKIKKVGDLYIIRVNDFTYQHRILNPNEFCYVFGETKRVGSRIELFYVEGHMNYGPTEEELKIMNKYGWDLDGYFTLQSQHSFNLVFNHDTNWNEFRSLIRNKRLTYILGEYIFWKYVQSGTAFKIRASREDFEVTQIVWSISEYLADRMSTLLHLQHQDEFNLQVVVHTSHSDKARNYDQLNNIGPVVIKISKDREGAEFRIYNYTFSGTMTYIPSNDTMKVRETNPRVYGNRRFYFYMPRTTFIEYDKTTQNQTYNGYYASLTVNF